jgi:hypothetical protein
VWNWFDIGFFLFFISASGCDAYTYWELEVDETGLGRLLKPRASGGGGDSDSSNFELTDESGFKQATRILYAWLIIFGFFKLMAQI